MSDPTTGQSRSTGLAAKSAVPGLDRPARMVLGFALLLPALLALVWSYLLPSLATLRRSFQDAGWSRPSRSGWSWRWRPPCS